PADATRVAPMKVATRTPRTARVQCWGIVECIGVLLPCKRSTPGARSHRTCGRIHCLDIMTSDRSAAPWCHEEAKGEGDHEPSGAVVLVVFLAAVCPFPL